jgi:hypothetical protein
MSFGKEWDDELQYQRQTHSSQRKENWTSKQCHRVMLPELHKLCSVPKDKLFKVKGKAALFLSLSFPLLV